MPTESERPFSIGDVIAGKYRIERLLGEGGMGIVAAATHLQLEQLVAIKFILPSMLESKVVVERFLREARATVRLKSEHCARVIDVDTLPSGVPYMVMEYLEGCDLSKILKTDGRLPLEAAADYVVQACEAVAEAHVRGIVHRDLKPQNLFLTRGLDAAAHVKVLDFGISKMADDYTSGLTNPQVMMGSPQYMAPEQMRASPSIDGRADVWALGVVLYRLLTNELPFGSGPMPEICFRVVNEPARSLAEAWPDAPPALVAIVERCLQKDPQRRFATAGELASALEPFAPSSAQVAAKRARAADAGRASMLSIPPAHEDIATPAEGIVSTPGPVRAEHAPTKEVPSLVAWDGPKGTWSGGRSRLLVIGAVLVIAVVAVLSRRGGAPAPSTMASGSSEPVVLGSAFVAAPLRPATTAAPTGEPGATAPVATAPSTGEPVPLPSAPPAPRPQELAPAARPHAAPSAVPSAKPQPAASDDDIPSLR